MIFEQAATEKAEEIALKINNAKKDYENAVNRFNNATCNETITLAIFDMNTALKRMAFIIKSADENGL